MNKKLKKILTQDKKKLVAQISVIAIVIVVGVIVINFTLSHANPTSSNFLKDQTVDGLLFTRTKYDNNKLTVIVKNNASSVYNLKTIDVTFYDNNGEKITTIRGYIGDKIDANSYKQLVVQTDLSLENANSITYTINK